jgi:C4-dicarboxylate transporter
LGRGPTPPLFERDPVIERGAGYRWLLVIALATIVNVGYGAIFYAFSVLLGEDAAAREFSRTALSTSLGMGVVVSGALALLVGTLCDVMGPFRGVASVGEVRPTSLLRRSEKVRNGHPSLELWN